MDTSESNEPIIGSELSDNITDDSNPSSEQSNVPNTVLCDSIKPNKVFNNGLLYFDWSEKFDYSENILNDVKKIQSLMQKRSSPRTPYFKNNFNRNSPMTFTMKNSFSINRIEWACVMRLNLLNWCKTDCGLVKLSEQFKSTPINIIKQHEVIDLTEPEPPPNVSDQQQCNMYELLQDENLSHQCMDYNKVVHERRLSNFLKMNAEQQAFITSIRNSVIVMSDMTTPAIKCFLLTGHAGSGKTSTLQCLRDIGNISLKYIAITQRLCAAVRRNYKIKTMTFCSFMIHALGMKPYDAMMVTDAMSYLPADSMLNHEFTSLKKKSLLKIFNSTFKKVCPKQTKSALISSTVNVIFLDEISMFSPPVLESFVAMIKVISTLMREKIIIILSGDFMQISPLFTASMNYEPLLQLCENVFNFTHQHRIIDNSYLKVVMKLTSDILIPPQQFVDELRTIIPSQKFSNDVQYLYPFKIVENAYNSLQRAQNLYDWLKLLPNNFFDKILPTNVFVFTNKEMHYMNMLLAFSVISQFKDNQIDVNTTQQLVCFSTFTQNGTDVVWPIPVNHDNIIPVLPLIRFFPYRLLANTYQVGVVVHNKCLVYLIDWDFKLGKIVVYAPDIETFMDVSFGKFKMNLANDMLYGVPLELAFCTTYHSSQGLTLTGDIVVSLNNIDARELFVVLTRIRSAKQIKNIFYNR